MQVVPLSDPATGEVPAVHLALSDSTVIEYTDGGATVWHSPDYKVMTNSPIYDQQLELLAKIEGFGGDAPMPGSTNKRYVFTSTTRPNVVWVDLADLDLSEGASAGRPWSSSAWPSRAAGLAPGGLRAGSVSR